MFAGEITIFAAEIQAFSTGPAVVLGPLGPMGVEGPPPPAARRPPPLGAAGGQGGDWR
jgi:hypothetical protein